MGDRPTWVSEYAWLMREVQVWVLCRETGVRAVNGICPTHNGDACLFNYACVSDLHRVGLLDRDMAPE